MRVTLVNGVKNLTRTKKRLLWLWSGVLIWLLIVFLTQKQYLHQNVAVVENASVIKRQTVQSEYHNQDVLVTQKLQLSLLTGKLRRHQCTIKNKYYQSQATSVCYHTHDLVILSNTHKLQNLTLISPKRDTILLILFGIVIGCLLGLFKEHGARAWLSAGLNCLLFILLLQLATKWHNQHILFLVIIFTWLATPLTLTLVFGYSRQTLIASVATLISTFLAVGLSTIVLITTQSQGIHYETLDYGIQPFQTIFLAETLLGVLGACMDETTDITAAVYQLLKEQPQITYKQLLNSGMNVGREIIGPLINILFYLFLAELLPIIVLYLRNGNTLQFALSRTMTLGYTQTVISALGIVLAVPLTAFLAAYWLRGEQKCGI